MKKPEKLKKAANAFAPAAFSFAYRLSVTCLEFTSCIQAVTLLCMRLYNNAFTREMTERNAPLLYDLYVHRAFTILHHEPHHHE